MAWLEQRGERFRIVFRFRKQRFHVNLKEPDQKEADACLARLEENLRLVERGRLTVPAGTDAGAKELITRQMEDIHMNHLTRIIGGRFQPGGSGCGPAGDRRIDGAHHGRDAEALPALVPRPEAGGGADRVRRLNDFC